MNTLDRNRTHTLLNNLDDPTIEDLLQIDSKDMGTIPFETIRDFKELVLEGRIDPYSWASLYANTHDILFEEDERQFYKYNYPKINGGWGKISLHVLETDVAKWLVKTMSQKKDLIRLQGKQRGFIKQLLGALEGIANKSKPFEGKKKLLHCQNGMFLIGDDGTLNFTTEFSPKYYSRNVLSVKYDPLASCPKFNQMLNESIPVDDQRMLRMYAGQIVLGENVSQRMLILSGVTNSSKSTILNILAKLIGQHNCQQLRTKHLEEKFEHFFWLGKTLLLGVDVKPWFLSCNGATELKNAMGGDPLWAEKKQGNECFQCEGKFNIVVATNYQLRLRFDGEGDSGAWGRRVLPITTLPPVEGREIEYDYATKLIKEEGSGILNWAIEGLKDLQNFVVLGKHGWPLTKAQQERIQVMLEVSDSLRIFVQRNIEKGKKLIGDGGLTINDIVERYYEYCEEKGYEQLPEQQVRKDVKKIMRELFNVSGDNHGCGKNGNQRGFTGVRFRRQANI
jgi:putative DNA primase/helicase